MLIHQNQPSTTRPPFADYPALAALRLTAPQLEALAAQGFVRQEQRGNSVRHKLCFRHDKVQLSRYIQTANVTAVQQDLHRLQADRDLRRRLVKLDRQGRRLLPDLRTIVEPYVLAENFQFHGRSLRLPRWRARQRASQTFIDKEVA